MRPDGELAHIHVQVLYPARKKPFRVNVSANSAVPVIPAHGAIFFIIIKHTAFQALFFRPYREERRASIIIYKAVPNNMANAIGSAIFLRLMCAS